MDIYSKAEWPSSDLSNFAPHEFVFEGVKCASMEGFIQSLKFKTSRIQKDVCNLVGIIAKRRGQKRNKAWKKDPVVWWKGKAIGRYSREYQDLLDRAFEALSKNDNFKKALLSTGNVILTHSVGAKKKSNTILTEQEFCLRLMFIRKKLK
jgi:predicted NAD-dependent protein-ADP-ribosyltransferase YbiA (DUF1768 family)